MPSTSMLKKSIEEPCVDVRCVISRISIRITAFQVKKTNAPEDELPLVMEYCPEFVHEKVEQPEDFAATYKYYTKNTKSIKFTNQVTVLYFNGEDILCTLSELLLLPNKFDRFQANPWNL